MQITNVRTEQYYSGIPLLGWESVDKALNAFAIGMHRNSHATTHEIGRQIESGQGGMGLGIFLLASDMISSKSKIVERLLSDAKPALECYDVFSHSWDYDAMGTPFMKSTVTIRMADREQDLYLLEIGAAFVAKEPEQNLGDYLGVPRALMWSQIEVEFTPLDAERFCIDFDEIARRLRALEFLESISGYNMAQAMLGGEDNGRGHVTYMLKSSSNPHVILSPGEVANRFAINHETGEKSDGWAVDGSRWTGHLREDYGQPPQKLPPTICITVSHYDSDDKRRIHIWQPEQKQEVLGLTDRIAAAFWSD